ncbi:NAD(P)/FAD-dependent oxidoreductase [Tuberibacillus sp. Marseille-P3662]|uniref:NAD(P)/FAD-dependent oxidoreductase n=1 Tax=Tuberibacillus sp. Marseille-P3662 TaxID=1965358 RepID=UPI000A1CBA99|nr:NAD(P)/FAD-dependent oxidoreductase [Tuberibacillus sp. Marseille-P3662]
MEKLLILGGGYGGMRILNHLTDMTLPEELEITLIDREPYHCMKTEYYALAAGTTSDQDVRVTFPEHPRLKVINGHITDINLQDQQVEINNDRYESYDTLIIGLGSEDKFHNIPGADTHTLGIQSINSVRETAQNLQNIHKNGTVSIVGAGLSGIEVASELHESRPDLTIRLFDRGDRILSTFPEKVSEYVHDWFSEHGVQVVNRANITKVEPGILYNKDEPVHTDTIVWTAGIQPHHLVRNLDVEKDHAQRIILSDHHFIPEADNVFVIGDCASSDHAPSAQLAEAQGDQIIKVLQSRWNNEPLPDLSEIKSRGTLGSLGKKKGFGLFMGNTPLTGRVARLLKSGVLWLYRYHNG